VTIEEAAGRAGEAMDALAMLAVKAAADCAVVGSFYGEVASLRRAGMSMREVHARVFDGFGILYGNFLGYFRRACGLRRRGAAVRRISGGGLKMKGERRAVAPGRKYGRMSR
jgi:hypothetical protein